MLKSREFSFKPLGGTAEGEVYSIRDERLGLSLTVERILTHVGEIVLNFILRSDTKRFVDVDVCCGSTGKVIHPDHFNRSRRKVEFTLLESATPEFKLMVTYA